ncbi:type I restriction endonuclease [Propionispora vibrioides]|uniref:Restriction endonuclease type I HsdR N-terminal domain-containing protein n=1 Tax=Propionispora vibrioides TaxID=112903 RepID=A0A1H8XQB4_9FIRM|nr:type I restriction endonuclease [Propionispora vibrioides]SEP41961.1 hypothetical protein SAMN04490178_12730 [Propionispora vibrioides]
MDFIDQLKQFSNRVSQLKDQIMTEEATKTSMIMPFFQILGYDVFNPSEFVPEFTADVGIKKGEKVDYAILSNNNPVILIEAKWCGENLSKHDSQLFRYFGTTSAKFAILTNGFIYKFYTDLENPNVMDDKPFFEFNLLDIKESTVAELKKFHKQSFDIDTVFNTASELKYAGQIRQYLAQQLSEPDDNFVNFLLGEIYSGRKTQAIIEKFRGTVKNSLNQFVSEIMNDRIKAALDQTQAKESIKETTEQVAASAQSIEEEKSKIVTTDDELEAFYIIKAILRSVVAPARLAHRDTESYFGILLDDNKLKWICRLQLDGHKKYLIIPDKDKKPVKYPIESIDNIYEHQAVLEEAVCRYLC